jgi:hypothetical protein
MGYYLININKINQKKTRLGSRFFSSKISY